MDKILEPVDCSVADLTIEVERFPIVVGILICVSLGWEIISITTTIATIWEYLLLLLRMNYNLCISPSLSYRLLTNT